jgi:hypothetical protein
MTLPKISHPTFRLTVPSSKKQLTFRPFLVKEEKILLMAKTSDDNNDILSAVKQVVNNCCQENNFDVNKLTIFDLEYLFLKIRSNSVGNMVPLSFKDLEDDKEYKFEVDLNTIEVKFPKNVDSRIKIDDKTGIVMRYPSASLYDDKDFLSLGQDAMFELMLRCVDKIYSGDEMFDPSSYTREQMADFMDGLDVKTFEKIQEFLSSAPSMSHTLTYKNSLGHDRKIELTTLNDFFTLR